MNILKATLAGVALAMGVTGAHAAITLVADPDYPPDPAVFTLDPEAHSPAARNVAADRQIRQTFQVSSDVEVAQVIISLAVQDGGGNGGLVVSFYEVDDVNASSWMPGDLVSSITIDPATTLPTTSTRLGVSLSEEDIFTLLQRNEGTQGYGLQVSNVDGATNVGAFRHSNSGVDEFLLGRYYAEGGDSPGGGLRDLGVALVAIPEPSVAMLMLGGLGVLSLARRRNR